MKSLMVILRCTIGCAIGSGLGVALITAGRIEHGIGLAIIGGVFGIVLAISNVLYKTSSAETFSRGLLIFLKLTAAKNIPGGEKFVPVKEKDTEGRHGQSADPVALDKRMYFGMKVGAVLAVSPAILIAMYMQDANREPDPMVLEIVKRIIIGIAFIAFVGGGCGATLGSLTVSGVHRRNIVLGTFVGAVIGAGLATAIVPGARVPAWHMYIFGCGVFGWLGMACGLFSGDNYRPTARDVADDLDDFQDA
ncbi:hypothetical protein [Roseimaritima sediminicola]|uniref:hypothetical protein n=1 Tax=Roseimaritima sediminicola TaxID=2662066 RepID=UPI0012984CA4|nr:hypothetical protein [Roseimaritima sediminicola]